MNFTLDGIQWPNSCTSAVSLTFDDGTESQLELGGPLLEKYGLKASFYLNTGVNRPDKQWLEWKKVQEAGHEIGNHSTTHPIPANIKNPGSMNRCLDDMTLEEIEKDVLGAEKTLTEIFGAKQRSYAYPCYESYIGSGVGRQSYVPIIAKHFVAGRGTGEFGFNNPLSCDLHYLSSWRSDGLSNSQIVGLAENYSTICGWQVFTFHSIGNNRLGISTYEFERFLKYLDRQKGSMWVAPVAVVAKYVIDRIRK